MVPPPVTWGRRRGGAGASLFGALRSATAAFVAREARPPLRLGCSGRLLRAATSFSRASFSRASFSRVSFSRVSFSRASFAAASCSAREGSTTRAGVKSRRAGSGVGAGAASTGGTSAAALAAAASASFMASCSARCRSSIELSLSRKRYTPSSAAGSRVDRLGQRSRAGHV
ncbi:hypothetical protein HC891_27090 [Candidatus Gracilibacteria bacterium]|nr:hypothetical protein [Candidatus Gracilibacteria bacterium]